MSLETDLETLLAAAAPLAGLAEDKASARSEGKWSKKEILGHLIDSAGNNLQRFVRLQQTATLNFPGYDQTSCVTIQRYQERSWKDLFELWLALNRHIAHVVKNIAPTALASTWRTKDGDLTLEFLVKDYASHMRHHLTQLGV